MTAPKDRFWAKVLFREFIRHFRKLNDEEIVKDIKQSMDDLDDLNDSGTSFGAKMVKWSIDRRESPSAIASRENGARGGRPKTKPEDDSEAIPEEATRQAFNPYQRIKPPSNKDEVFSFAADNGIPDWCAIDFFEMNSSRGWIDRNGKTIYNWKGAIIKYYEAVKAKENESK